MIETLQTWFSHAPVVQDPAFYALAVVAVLLTGVAKSGFASGFGALATPLVALAVPVPQAAAIMLPLLVVMDFAGIGPLWHARDRRQLRLVLPWGIVGTLVGAALFGVLSTKAVAGVVGGLTLLFLVQRLFFPPHPDGSVAPRWVGAGCALAAGFTSFVAHAGSPPIAAYLLPQKLKPLVFSGTMAVFFTTMNLFKFGPYIALGLFDTRNLLTSALLLPLAPLGVWIGVRLTGRISPKNFYRLAYTGMALTGLKLLWDGLKP